MKSVSIFVVVLTLSLAGIAQASVCPGTNVIEDPEIFLWTNEGGYWSGTLEIGEATFTIGGNSLTTRAYRQEGSNFTIPGPTMYMTPGQTYVLKFRNTLPYAPPSPDHNTMKDPNITNVHTHGLHVSGETPADDVMRLINGGECADYVYQIPADHMGGTHWYHPHHHGSTYLQVAGGAFGLLIVDDAFDGVPAGVAGMTERQIVIGYLDPSAAGAGGDTLLSGTLSPTWTVNGKIQGNLCAPPNEWQHWRMLIAHWDARMKTVSVGPECEVALLARDGVWRTEAPKALTTNSIDLSGASRADLAVRCSADSTISVNGTAVANIYADGSLPSNTLAGPYSSGSGGTTWSAWRPSYLRDLRGNVTVEKRTVNMGARTINGSKFDPVNPTFSISAGSIQEWDIKGATNHPFHLHVYHYQMQSSCGTGGAFEAGEYYDTIAGSCLMRFDLNPATSSVYDGRTVMHCHILTHEDEGAMGWSDVIGGNPPPISPDPNHKDIYQCGGSCTPTGVSEGICNGFDDDCDGVIDEDYTASPTTCGLGECTGNTGELICMNGSEVNTCDPLAGSTSEGLAGDPTCADNLDNDCNGLTDIDDPACQQTSDCSLYMTKPDCNSDTACRWKGSTSSGQCTPK